MWKISRQLRMLSILAVVLIEATLIQAQARDAANLRYLESGPSINSSLVLDPAKDIVLANRAIAALKQLEANVIVYQSQHEFEASGKLARVSFETFNAELLSVSAEIDPSLDQLSDKRLRMKLRNSLYSFRDGAFWWAKVTPRHVVSTTTLGASFSSITPAEVFLTATTPYTVAIHWRQASKFLLHAERLLAQRS
jgi:hypothetical protein